MYKKIVFLISFSLLSTLFLCNCNNTDSDDVSNDLKMDENLISAAIETSTEFNASGVQRTIYQFNEIPNEFWASGIETMDPIKVYSHNSNIAIVLTDSESEEEGIYVYVPFSSYLPESDDSLEYTAIKKDIYEFTRRK